MGMQRLALLRLAPARGTHLPACLLAVAWLAQQLQPRMPPVVRLPPAGELLVSGVASEAVQVGARRAGKLGGRLQASLAALQLEAHHQVLERLHVVHLQQRAAVPLGATARAALRASPPESLGLLSDGIAHGFVQKRSRAVVFLPAPRAAASGRQARCTQPNLTCLLLTEAQAARLRDALLH